VKELKRNVPFIGILMPCSKATTSLCSKAMLDDRIPDIPQGPFYLELDEFGLVGIIYNHTNTRWQHSTSGRRPGLPV
jgi:hypothetical protein